MKLNASKNKPMIVSRSFTIHPHYTPLPLDGTVKQESAALFMLDVTFDADFKEANSLYFQRCNQMLGIMRKSWQVFHDQSLILRTFLEFSPAGL